MPDYLGKDQRKTTEEKDKEEDKPIQCSLFTIGNKSQNSHSHGREC